jgi:hypothetical protein
VIEREGPAGLDALIRGLVKTPCDRGSQYLELRTTIQPVSDAEELILLSHAAVDEATERLRQPA